MTNEEDQNIVIELNYAWCIQELLPALYCEPDSVSHDIANIITQAVVRQVKVTGVKK